MSGARIEVLRLAGSPGDRGVQHGRALADVIEIHWEELVKDVTERVARPVDEPWLRRWVQERGSPALAVAPNLEEEIRGIGEGSGLGFEAALGVNFFEEIADLRANLGPRGGWAPGERCSSVVVPRGSTSHGHLLLGQTWDGADWYADPLVFIVEEEAEEGGGRMAYLTDAGVVGGVGVNDQGLGSVHTGVTLRDHPQGLPYAVIARRILEAGSLEEAVASVRAGPSAAGCHYVVTDGSRTVDLEAAGRVSAVRELTPPASTCAHFEDPTCAEQQTTDDEVGSRFRTERLRRLVTLAGRLSPEDVFALLADHQHGPGGITVCRHPGWGGDTRTSGSVVLDPEGRGLLARAGNPCEGRPAAEVLLVDDRVLVRTAEASGGDG